MKTIRTHLSKISIFMGLLLMFVSCNQYDDLSLNKDYSAKDVFKSVIFGTGEFAKNISIFNEQSKSIERLDINQKDKMLNNIELLVTAIENENPSFFNSFKRKIKSGNHNEINSAIEEAGKVIENNLKVIIPNYESILKNIKSDIVKNQDNFQTTEGINNYVNNFKNKNNELLNKNIITNDDATLSPCTWAIACVVYFVLAAHNTVAVAANVYLVFALWGWKLSKPNLKQAESDTLKSEILVQEIASIKW